MDEITQTSEFQKIAREAQKSAQHDQIADVCDSLAQTVDRLAHPISRYLCYSCGFLIIVMALGIVVDIVSRLLFAIPLNGMIEYQTFTLVTVIFLSMAYTAQKDGHVSVDLITSKFSEKLKAFLGSVFSIWSVALCVLITWQEALRAIIAYSSGEAAVVTAIPSYPFYAIASFGFLLMSLVLFSNIFKFISAWLTVSGHGWMSIIPIALVSIGFLAIPILLRTFSINIGPVAAGALGVCLLLIIMLLGLPISFAMGIVGFLGLWYLIDIKLTLSVIRLNTYDYVAHYFYSVVPFFILMGFLSLKAGIGHRLFHSATLWFGRLPGGLGIATILGCGGFSAICGDSMATAATMGSVAFPEIEKNKYEPSLATGALAAGGTLGILIPPSIGFVIYGMITEQSIGKLFIAGLIPGILLALIFAAYIFVRCVLNPTLAPKPPKSRFMERIISLKDVWEVGALFAVVMGGIYSGITTPTEAGGIGVIGALIISIFSKEFSWKGFLSAISTSAQMTAMIFMIVIGVNILGYFVSMTDIPMVFADFIKSLEVSRWTIFLLILLLYLFLGMVMNIIPMMMLTLPILFPTVMALGYDPIWFGVIMVIMMEMGQITPPIGVNVFVIYGVAKNIPMSKIFIGIAPFIVLEIVMIILLSFFPELATYLPSVMDVLESIDY